MARTAFILFSIWFLLLPFSRLSALYFSVAGLAVDKIMAPFLVLVWLALFLGGGYTLGKKKLQLLILVFVFFAVRNISFFDNALLFSERVWRDAILFGYFALPILFIDNLKRVDIAGKMISVNAVVACLSAFLVALSIITLPYDRFAESRIGFEGIQKSIGLITSYGDVAQLAAFFLLFGFFMPGKIFPVGKKKQNLIKVIVLLVVIMGLIGNQSRNYLLSIIFSFTAAMFYSYRSRKATNASLVDMVSLLSVIIILPFIIFMLGDIVSSLAGIGGKGAMGTASARLGQYELAYTLIREYPLFGIDAEYYLKNPYFAHGVHNFWLGQLTTGGIVSVMLLLVIVIKIFRRCISLFKSNNDNTVGYAKVLVGYLAAVFLSILFYPADNSLFWALLGMCASIIYTLGDDKGKSFDKSAVENIALKDSNKRVLHIK